LKTTRDEIEPKLNNKSRCKIHPEIELVSFEYQSGLCLECDFSFEAINERSGAAKGKFTKDLNGLQPPKSLDPVLPKDSIFTDADQQEGFNPFLDELRKLCPDERALWTSRKNFSTATGWDFRPQIVTEMFCRRYWIYKFSYAIPNHKALIEIQKYSPVIEIGAGTGYWASLLAKLGCDIKAYDRKDPEFSRNHSWHPVAYGDEETIADHPQRTLFLCWPPMSSTAYDCLRRYQGEYLVYVGEYNGGCTANEDFFDLLGQEWDLVKTVEIPVWSVIDDCLDVYKRQRK